MYFLIYDEPAFLHLTITGRIYRLGTGSFAKSFETDPETTELIKSVARGECTPDILADRIEDVYGPVKDLPRMLRNCEQQGTRTLAGDD